MNNAAFAELLQGLLVVAQLKPNFYLYTKGQNIGVGPKSYITWATRWFQREHRYENMERVERLVHTAITELERVQRSAALEGGVPPGRSPETQFDELHKRKAIRTRQALLTDALGRTRHGLAMMRTTYRGDGLLEARVDVLDNFIEAALSGSPHAARAAPPREQEDAPGAHNPF